MLIRSKDPDRDIAAKKSLLFSLANQTNYNSRYTQQSSYTTAQPNKKNLYLCSGGNKCLLSNTLVIVVNATTIKKARRSKNT